MERIGVRELRQNASRYLARVAAGESLEITDRGTPVAQLVPLTEDPWQSLVRRGLVVPAQPAVDVLDVSPVVLEDGALSLSEALQELRADDR